MVVENEARDETVAFYLKYPRISFGTKRLLNIQRMFQGLVQKTSWCFVSQSFKQL